MVRLRRELRPDIQLALKVAERWMAEDQSGNIHQVYWGQGIEKGMSSAGPEIVFVVKRKVPDADVALLGSLLIPKTLVGYLRTDVQERPRAEIRILRTLTLGGWPLEFTESLDAAVAILPHQQCHNAPIPGGVQIQPDGAAWLGTLGCKVVYRDDAGKLRHGAITNYHVATDVRNRPIIQPSGAKPWFARVAYSPGVKFGGAENHIDIAVLDIERTDGAYAPVTHTVKPEQVTLGTYSKELSTGGLDTRVARDGRTLGRVTDGVCVGIGASARVGYGEGEVALFTDQLIVTRTGGEFSAPGDSGSFVFEWPAMRAFGLLFAGGGGTTIVSPVEYAISEARVHSFQ